MSPDNVYESKYIFTVQGMPNDAFLVTDIRGTEGLNDIWNFELKLIGALTYESDGQDKKINAADIIDKNGRLEIKRADEESSRIFSGIITDFNIDEYARNASSGGTAHAVYSLRLEHLLCQSKYNVNTATYMSMTPVEAAVKCIEKTIAAKDIKKVLDKCTKIPVTGPVLQKGESDYKFFSRVCEKWGVAFRCPDNAAELEMRDGKFVSQSKDAVQYEYAEKGLVDPNTEEKIFSVRQVSERIADKVSVQVYNYTNPKTPITKTSVINKKEATEVKFYLDELFDEQTAQLYADLRAEELISRQTVYNGMSTAPMMQAGECITISSHPLGDVYNGKKMLVTEVVHEGSSENADIDTPVTSMKYKNTFKAIDAGKTYRPLSKTAKPDASGVTRAKVAKGQGTELGEYEVEFDYDNVESDGAGDQKMRKIRKSNPYAGEDKGFHAPFDEGQEVILSFRDGNVDSPVIMGEMYNGEKKLPFTEDEDKLSEIFGIKTESSKLEMHDDDKGKFGMLLETEKKDGTGHEAKIGLGTAYELTDVENSPEGVNFLQKIWDSFCNKISEDKYQDKKNEELGLVLATDGKLKIETGETEYVNWGNEFKIFFGSEEDVVIGGHIKAVIGAKVEFTGISLTDIILGFEKKYVNFKEEVNAEHTEITGVETNVTEERTDIVEEENDIMTVNVNLSEEQTRAIETAIEFFGNRDQVIEQAVLAALNSVEANEVKAKVNEMALSAIETQLTSEGTVLNQAITRLEQVDTRLGSVVTALNEATVEITDSELTATFGINIQGEG